MLDLGSNTGLEFLGLLNEMASGRVLLLPALAWACQGAGLRANPRPLLLLA